MRVAAVDVGTNSTRLLIADAEGGAITELRRETIVTRLGRGVAAAKRLDDRAMKRTLQTLADYRKAVDAEGVERVIAVATSAARDAENVHDFVTAVSETTGWDLKILAGEDEARLTFLGAASDPRVAPPERTIMVIDIGGGSTELVLGRQGRTGQIVSFDMGCVRLLEIFLTDDPPRPEQIEEVFGFVDGLLRGYWPAERPDIDRAVAVAGTPTSLVAIHRDIVPYNPELVHGATLTREQVDALLARLGAMTLAELRALPALDPARADVIVAGAAILAKIMDFFDLPAVAVSERDILDGLALEAAGAA